MRRHAPGGLFRRAAAAAFPFFRSLHGRAPGHVGRLPRTALRRQRVLLLAPFRFPLGMTLGLAGAALREFGEILLGAIDRRRTRRARQGCCHFVIRHEKGIGNVAGGKQFPGIDRDRVRRSLDLHVVDRPAGDRHVGDRNVGDWDEIEFAPARYSRLCALNVARRRRRCLLGR
ncbi:MAG: hypothetical protein KIT16_09940 [Rhodospirillaceae bacterium]|nr:hypothetical protein [Rhodospirillaceae bacterium]